MQVIKTMTTEPKGELIKMNNWENILKAVRDRKGKLGGGKEIPEKVLSNKVKRPTQTRMKGGNPIADLNPRGRVDSLDMVFEEDMSNLAEMTREDLIDRATNYIKSLSKEQIIAILERTQGTLEEKL
jgi:hypothetical protein